MTQADKLQLQKDPLIKIVMKFRLINYNGYYHLIINEYYRNVLRHRLEFTCRYMFEKEYKF